MEIEALRIFIRVAHQASFAAVAREHGLDPSSVSRLIAQLEQQVGVRLFQRTTRRLTLTEAGELYLRRVEALVDELDRARDEALSISTMPTGMLRLTASVAFGKTCLVPLIPTLRAEFPGLALELLLTDANLDLVAERIDLAIRLAPSINADAVGTRLMDTHYRVCAAPEYLAKVPALNQPASLSNHSCLLFTLVEFRSRWLFRDASNNITEVPVHGDVVISNALAVRECAIMGLGPALLPNWLIDEDLQEGRLVDVFPKFQVAATTFETGVWALYPSRSFLPTKVRVAIDFLRQQLRTSGHRKPARNKSDAL